MLRALPQANMRAFLLAVFWGLTMAALPLLVALTGNEPPTLTAIGEVDTTGTNAVEKLSTVNTLVSIF